MVKTNKKSVVALIVMAFLLVASIVMAATGAWFTDTANKTSSNLTFGTLGIEVTETTAVAASNTIDTDNTKAMPGSTITGVFTVKNTGDSAAWVRYKLEVVGPTGEGTTDGSANVSLDLTSVAGYKEGYVYLEVVEGGASKTVDVAASIEDSVGNTAQGTSFAIKITVEAVQQANNGATADAADWSAIVPNDAL